jgi:hypothetical protein
LKEFPAFAVLFGAAIFVLWWCLVVGVISFLSGWRRMAEKLEDRPDGILQETLRWQSMALGWANYGMCVTMELYSGGVRLSVMPIFGVGHAPFFIPWRRLTACSRKRILGIEYSVFVVSDEAGRELGRLTMRGVPARKIREAAEGLSCPPG